MITIHAADLEPYYKFCENCSYCEEKRKMKIKEREEKEKAMQEETEEEQEKRRQLRVETLTKFIMGDRPKIV
jgi:hypothetical protein